MSRIRALWLTFMALACFSCGCGKKPVSDQALTTDIQAKLYGDAATKGANINVAVSNGVVTLSGDVANPDVELEAMKIANGTAGVRRVNDQMKVNPSSAANPMQTAPSAPSQSAGSYPPVSSAPAAAVSAPVQQQPPPLAPSTAPRSRVAATITIPAGTRVSVRTIDSIDSARNTTGQVFRASLDAPIVSHRRVVVPRGAPASIVLAAARDAGHIKGRSELEVRLSSFEYHGRAYPLESSVYEEEGKARGKQTAERTGIGAVAGAVIGAIAGGGKGAAIGSAAGGGAGAGFQLFTHGQQVKIPSETVLTFRLEAPVRLRV